MTVRSFEEQLDNLLLDDTAGDTEACLELLASMYPEFTVNGNSCTLFTELQPQVPVKYALIDNKGQEVDSFLSLYIEGFKFTFSLPLTREGYTFESTFFDSVSFSAASKHIDQIIDEAQEACNEELASMDLCNYIINELPSEFVDGVLPKHRYMTSDHQQFQQWNEMVNSVRRRQFINSRHECPICLYTRSGPECVLLDCDHKMCRACLKDLALSSIDNGDVLDFRCPDCPIESKALIDSMTQEQLREKVFGSTKRMLSDEALAEIIGKDLLSKYHTLLQKRKFQTFAQHYPLKCSECQRCGAWDFKLNPYEKIVRCDFCPYAYCYECKKPWHGGKRACFGGLLKEVPVEDLERFAHDETSQKERDIILAKHGRLALRAALSGHVAQKQFDALLQEDESMTVCPKCKVAAQKDDGCNVMACTLCQTKFCFICLNILSNGNNDPYHHFNDGYSPCYDKLYT